MGLGKTLQTISFMAFLRENRRENGPHLVIVPLTTLDNWIRELGRWCPEIRVLRYWGIKEDRVCV